MYSRTISVLPRKQDESVGFAPLYKMQHCKRCNSAMRQTLKQPQTLFTFVKVSNMNALDPENIPQKIH